MSQKKNDIVEVLKDIVQYKTSCEANVVGCLWKQPDLYDTYDGLNEEDFSKDVWRLYFKIGKEIYQGENKRVLDDLTTGLYLEKHKDEKSKYLEFGGYKTIEELKGFVEIENLEGYVEELEKWQKVLELHKMNFPIAHMIGKIKDISLEQLYDYYEAQLNHIFMSKASGSSKSYNACEGIHQLISDCDKGLDVGFPLTPKMLNDEINGMNKGNIIISSAGSGVGKTTTAIQWILPNMIELDEKVVMVINEQDEVKIKQELLTWVVNNIFDGDFNKKRLRQGKFTDKEMKLLRESADWIEEREESRNITIIPLQTYTTDAMIKVLKKYAALGVDYFILDTFKESDDSTEEAWREMMRSMRRLYDVVKPAGRNLSLFVTVQLTKNLGHNYLTQSSIGMSKNIVDVASVLILMRQVREDEKEGARAMKVYRRTGKSGRTRTPVTLDKDKQYVVIYIDKNRFGMAGAYQIIAEQDLGRNVYKEVGITVLNEDY